jgi:uncharacterized membrane protein YhiD involved in acid resistance
MIATSEFVLRLPNAALLGSLIAIERGRRARTAGPHTHMVACVAAESLRGIDGVRAIKLSPN